MAQWFWYAIAAAILYGLHQVFTKMASERIGDGVGGFVVELSAAAIIGVYLIYLRFFGEWRQPVTTRGVAYSILKGLCVGAGTVAFFLLFQKGGPLSAVPMVLAGGAALIAIIGIAFFREPASLIRIFGILLSLIGLFLLKILPRPVNACPSINRRIISRIRSHYCRKAAAKAMATTRRCERRNRDRTLQNNIERPLQKTLAIFSHARYNPR